MDQYKHRLKQKHLPRLKIRTKTKELKAHVNSEEPFMFCNISSIGNVQPFPHSTLANKGSDYTIRPMFACSFLYPRLSSHTLRRCPFCRRIPGSSENPVDELNFYRFGILQICFCHRDQTLPSLTSMLCFHLVFSHHSLLCFLHHLSMCRV